MPHVNLRQGRIDYEERGGGRPVVFVHGYLMGGEIWHDVADRLAPHGLRCIMPTWPLGAHTTPRTDAADATIDGVAATIAAFLDALDLRDVVLVGNDSGGALSQLVATRHPERLGALVLTNCDAFEAFPPAPFSLLPAAARIPGFVRAALLPMRSRAVRRSRFGLAAFSHADIDHLFQRWLRPAREDPRVLRDLVRFTTSIDKRATIEAGRRLHAFDRPVLLAWGTDDPFFKLRLAERLRDTFPDARLETLAARAFVMVDRPDELAGLIAEHAASTGAGAAGAAAA
ncbi:MAG TPA: alpha/beta hydrolase [Solirubrobacteraceae bacterium]|jgi:pimeloyl-ACP methyl ester carboxylesterase